MALGVYASRHVRTSTDFVLGGRSLNYVLTAMAAHASDMSSWLFMGYPGVIFITGLYNAWLSVGLILFMWLNWTYVAPKLRSLTESFDCTTLPSFFEKMVGDSSGSLKIVSGIFYFVFYSVYLCAGLVGLGVLGETALNLDYNVGITLSIAFILAYVFLGGYIALAWLDLFQGIFLLSAVLFVPYYIWNTIPAEGLFDQLVAVHPSLFELVPDYSFGGFIMILSMLLGWGLGYFGQPHILTKFMGIRHVDQMNKSRNIGMTWMTLALLGATAVGVVAIAYFPNGLDKPETVFIYMVKQTLHPIVASLILCAIIAATINVMSSQLLVLSTTLSEDLLVGVWKKYFPNKSALTLTRLCVLAGSLTAYLIAFEKVSSVFSLVEYAWSGLGASFGPLILLLLYTKSVTRQGALAGIVTGGLVVATWPLINSGLQLSIHVMVPAYIVSIGSILLISKFTRTDEIAQETIA